MTDKLLSIASDPRCGELYEPVGPLPRGLDEAALGELLELLKKKNGFYAFESALEVFGVGGGREGCRDVLRWNSPGGWRKFYPETPAPILFFAQDIVCVQFGIGECGVHRFEPESGTLEPFAPSVDAWADRILADYSYEVAWNLAHDWQVHHRELIDGERLIPRRPFVLGGNYTVENLVAVSGEIAMANLGRLYQQIREHPDGETITIHGWLEERGDNRTDAS